MNTLTIPPITFEPFPKIPRMKRSFIVTEKIDGTNAGIYITESGDVYASSRKRWITPEEDNYGFAAWVNEHVEELRGLGPGMHWGEWWGLGIQRNYGLGHKRFSLFNTSRWNPSNPNLPACCHVVPVLLQHEDFAKIDFCLDGLRVGGSIAAPGFMKPEGVVIYHTASRSMFKATLEDDHKGKEE